MYTIEKLENNKFKANVKIEKEQWNQYVEKAYENTKGKYNIQGFRKGKAPRKVIEQNYGADIFFDEALELAYRAEMDAILLNEKEIDLVDNPQINIDKFDENGLEMTFEMQGSPEVKLGEYKGLTIEAEKAEVTDEQVEGEIKQAQERGARYVEVQREAKLGDFVSIDFVGSVDGVEFPGGKAENYRLELGSKSFVDTFEEQIVGMNIGEKKIVKVTFPENYTPDLKGKKADFAVTLLKVEEKQLPEVNDEFASNVSEFETVADYKADIKKHLEESLKVKLERDTENKIISKIVEASVVDVPECMVEHQLESFMKDFETRLSYQNLKMEDYLNYTGQTLEQVKADRKAQAVDTIKTRLVLETIITKENLQVKEEELNAKIQEIASKYKKTVEDYKKSITERELIYFENAILMDKLNKFLKDNNTIN